MANPDIRYGTTNADGSVVTVNLPDDVTSVEIVNRDPVAELWATIDGKGGPGADGIPVVEGNDTEIVPPESSAVFTSAGGGPTVVKLCSAVAAVGVKYEVRGVVE